MINHSQLRELIIKPTLDKLVMNSDAAVELLLFTCAVESDGGSYLKQIKGPALGIYQMEPATYNDIWQNFIRLDNNLLLQFGIHFGAYRMPPEERLIYDLEFATAMARVHYRRVPKALPDAKIPNDIWEYYKKYYNTRQGSADRSRCLAAYEKFIAN